MTHNNRNLPTRISVVLVLLIIIVVVLIIVNKFYPLRQAFSDSGALIQLASSSPAYFPVYVSTDEQGNYVYPSGYPWLTNIPTRDHIDLNVNRHLLDNNVIAADPLYKTPYLAGIYGDWQYYNYPGLYPYYPFMYREVVDMNKVKASEEKDLKH